MKLFDKFGASEAIALLAVLVSVVALIQTGIFDGASIDVFEEPPAVGWYEAANTDSLKGYFSYTRILISNNGSQPTTLIGIRRPTSEPFEGMWSAAIPESGVTEIPTELFLTTEYIEDFVSDPALINEHETVSNERLSLLNQLVNPGQTIVINVGIRHKIYEVGVVSGDMIFQTIELYFSNEEIHIVRRAIEIDKDSTSK